GLAEALEPGDDPAAVGFEKEHRELREALADAARAEERDALHHVERVGERLAEEDVAEVADRVGRAFVPGVVAHALGADGAVAERAARARHVGGQEGVEPDRHLEVLAHGPDGIVDGIVQLTAPDGGVRAHEDAHQAELLRAADGAHGALDLLGGDDGGAEEALRRVGAVRVQPLVVSVGLHLGEGCILDRGQPEEHGRVEDRLRDALDLHVGETRGRAEGAGPDLRVAELSRAGALAIGGRHARRAREGHAARRRPVAAVDLPETVQSVGTGSAAYKRHTGTRRPSGPAGVLVGTWQQSGSTGDWPRVVNLREMDGWEGWGQLLEHQYGGEGQPAALAQWWSEAARLRSGGFDRILEPAPYCPTRAELIRQNVRGRAFIQEIATVFPGAADAYLEGVEAHWLPVAARRGLTLAGAWRTAMRDTEAVLLWCLPT